MTTERRIYVACLASYNAGKLHGAWIDADQHADFIRDAIDAMLRASPCPNVEVDCPENHSRPDVETASFLARDCKVCKGTGKVQSAEEWAIRDYEGFGDIKLSAHEDIERVADLASMLGDTDSEVLAFAIEACGDSADARDLQQWIDDHYRGTYRSAEEWAEEFLEDTGMFSGADEAIKAYFDYERWARDAEMGGDISVVEGGRGVHIFDGH